MAIKIKCSLLFGGGKSSVRIKKKLFLSFRRFQIEIERKYHVDMSVPRVVSYVQTADTSIQEITNEMQRMNKAIKLQKFSMCEARDESKGKIVADITTTKCEMRIRVRR